MIEGENTTKPCDNMKNGRVIYIVANRPYLSGIKNKIAPIPYPTKKIEHIFLTVDISSQIQLLLTYQLWIKPD